MDLRARYKMMDRKHSDLDLVRRASRGEVSAFEIIYREHNGWVVALASKLTANRDDALDVRQDAFTYLFRRLKNLELTTSLRGFLFPVVRNLCLTVLRWRRKGIALDAVWQEAENRFACPPVGVSDLEHLVDGLPEIHRQTVLLRFGQHLPIREIAARLDIPIGTVKSRLHIAMKALRSNEACVAKAIKAPKKRRVP